ncbi:MAG: FAD-binding oxidoreductase [Rhodospirillaceae bacterium]|nr:FAD-binding oxidoreductase [Rhodospirillaceae bacterium]
MTTLSQPDLVKVFDDVKGVVGPENVIQDATEREYFSQDYYKKADPVAAIIKPPTVDSLAAAVAQLSKAGVAMFPRGGGYSYTDAYLPTHSPGVCIDTRSLNKIVHVDEQDMYVTAEAGCTWAQLEEHLAPLGLRTPFWGPLSGLNATLGGGISQGSASLGSGKYGISPESVVSLDVVMADGSIIKTGSAGQAQHSPFFRHYGPDFTGLFCNDAGALGIKARVTMRLQKRKPLVQGLSFGFDDFETMAEAITTVAHLNVATENSGMTLSALRRATMTQSFSEDLKILVQVVRSGPDRLGSIIRALKMALHGRRYISGGSHSSANFVVEGLNKSHLKGQLDVVRAAVSGLGVEIPNTLPTVMRAQPFMDYDMLHPDGRRQLPMHAIFPFSRVEEFNAKYHALIANHEEQMDACGVTQISVYSGISTNGFLFEPVLIWPDAVEEFHRRHTSGAVLSNVTVTEPNGPARTLVAELRQKIVDLMYQCGGVHLQIGKAYPYIRDRDATQIRILQDLKNLIDPKSLFNPGALGLHSVI